MSKIKHKAIYTTHYYSQRYDTKVFDYADGVKVDSKQFDETYIVNVPCYRVEDVNQALTGESSSYFSLNCQQKLFNTMIRVETNNHTGKKFQYLIATPEVEEYVTQQAIFGIIKGYISKMPKKHIKVVRVFRRGQHGRGGPWRIDCYAQDKDISAYLTKAAKCPEVDK